MAAAEAEAKAVYSEVVSDSEVAMRRSAQGRFRLKAVERVIKSRHASAGRRRRYLAGRLFLSLFLHVGQSF